MAFGVRFNRIAVPYALRRLARCGVLFLVAIRALALCAAIWYTGPHTNTTRSPLRCAAIQGVSWLQRLAQLARRRYTADTPETGGGILGIANA
jgi:hypothetical protein